MLRPTFSTFSRIACLLLAPLVGALPAAHGATFKVQNLNDSGPGSLRAAILSANSSSSADGIDASAQSGVINLLTPLPQLRGALTIKGPGAAALTLQRSANSPFNVFAVAKGASIRLAGLTLTGGGGGLETGGAVSNEGALVLSNCTLKGNSARRGGGVFSTGALTVEGCTFSGNTANGGGAINTGGGSLTVSTSTFSGNVSAGDGGALILLQTRASLSRCTFVSNHTARAGYGGAILASGPLPLTRVGLAIANCTFAGNIARQGGALWTSGYRTEIQNSTMCDNFALWGAGIWSAGDTATATYMGGCILAGNAESPSVLGTDADSGSAKNTFVSRGYNLVGGGTGHTSFSKTGDRRGLSRQDLSLGLLGDNGGPTRTFAPLPSSPAVDAISTSALLVKIDQRGVARPIGKGGDIGAVEADTPIIDSFQLVVNSTSDAGDGACTATECTFREALDTANTAAASGSTQTYTITFDPEMFSTPQSIGVAQLPSRDDRLGFIARGNMKIIGPGANLLTIQLGQFNGLSPRLLDTGGSVAISGITFSGGSPYRGRGGAILNAGTLDLSGCVFKNNRAEGGAGGAILNTGTLSVRDCIVTDNLIRTYGLDSSGTGLETSFGGGGIYNRGTVFIKDSTISNNVASLNCLGGGLYNEGTATLENCTIAGNSTGAKGGGICSRSTGTLTILSCTISGNVASNTSNSAGSSYGAGGGIHSEGPLVLRNSTVAGNSVDNDARTSGGGVWTNGPTASIENCTITANNSRSYPAGGLYVYGGVATVSNSVIAANANNTIYPDVTSRYPSGSIVSGGHNFVGFGSSFSAPGDRAGGYTSDVGPLVVLDPRLGQLASNGGTVQTIAPLSDSPLINMGDPAFDATALPYDERGAGFPRVAGGRLDIGAFETAEVTPLPSGAKPKASRSSASSS